MPIQVDLAGLSRQDFWMIFNWGGGEVTLSPPPNLGGLGGKYQVFSPPILEGLGGGNFSVSPPPQLGGNFSICPPQAEIFGKSHPQIVDFP